MNRVDLFTRATWCLISIYFHTGGKFERFGKVQPSERTNEIILTKIGYVAKTQFDECACDKHVCERAFVSILLFCCFSLTFISPPLFWWTGDVFGLNHNKFDCIKATRKFSNFHENGSANKQRQTRLDANIFVCVVFRYSEHMHGSSIHLDVDCEG